MKVIKAGHLEPKIATIVCGYCEATLEIEEKDLTEDEKDWPILPTTWRFVCGFCGRTNHIGFDTAIKILGD